MVNRGLLQHVAQLYIGSTEINYMWMLNCSYKPQPVYVASDV